MHPPSAAARRAQHDPRGAESLKFGLQALGLTAVGHFRRIMPLLLPWCWAPDEATRSLALPALRELLTQCWPRIPAHAGERLLGPGEQVLALFRHACKGHESQVLQAAGIVPPVCSWVRGRHHAYHLCMLLSFAHWHALPITKLAIRALLAQIAIRALLAQIAFSACQSTFAPAHLACWPCNQRLDVYCSVLASAALNSSAFTGALQAALQRSKAQEQDEGSQARLQLLAEMHTLVESCRHSPLAQA